MTNDGRSEESYQIGSARFANLTRVVPKGEGDGIAGNASALTILRTVAACALVGFGAGAGGLETAGFGLATAGAVTTAVA